MTTADLLEHLGYGRPGNDVDDAVRWALVEVALLRQRLATECECDDDPTGPLADPRDLFGINSVCRGDST